MASENRYGLFADCIRTILVEPSTVSNYDNVVIQRDLTVDTNTLMVDSVNNRVGIVKKNPAYPLDIIGDINTTASIRIAGTQVLTSGILGSGVTASSLTSLGVQAANLDMGTRNIINAGTLAGTLTTAAQPNVTSLGSLTSLTVNAKALLNDSVNLGAYLTNVEGKGIFFRANAGAAFQEGGSSAFNLSITTWDQTTTNTTPDGMSFNAFDGFRWVTNSSSVASTIPMRITSGGVTTIDSLIVTNTLNNKQVCRAFINFNGSTVTATNSFNVSGITRNSTGVYTITFTTAMSDTNYVWFGSAGFNSTPQSNFVSSPHNTAMSTWKTTSTLRVQTYYANEFSNLNPHDINIIVWN